MTCTTLMSRHWGQRIIWSKDMLPGWGLILVTDSRSVLGLELQTSLLGFMNLNCGGCWEALGIVVLPPKSSWRCSKHVKASKTCQTHEIVQISNMFCPSCWFDIFPTSCDLVFSCPSTITCSLQQRQAGAWQPVTANNVPAARHGHTAVLDAKQRMWVFGGSNGAPEDKAARCGAHISMAYRLSEHPNRGYSFYLDIPYIYHDSNLGIILALYHIPMGYTIHIPFSCSTGVQGFNPDSYDEGMEKTPRNKPQLCPKVTWSTVHEWPVLLGCWGRKVGEPCQLADPSGPPKTRWNGYLLWWYPKSQLVSLLNPTILGYEGYPSPQIHPQNPGFMTTAGWFGCPQARAWQPVTADNAPAARHSHSAVLDAQRMWVFGGHVGQGPRSQHSWWLHPLLVVIVEVFSPTSTICTTLKLRRGSWEGKRVSVCEFR